MPRTTTVVSLFLASPSDVTLEREIVSRCVDEWNQIQGLGRSLIFELIRWENSVAAGFGTDGQAVINQQVGESYDALIAIFWARLGTETPRAISGTAEEYERAFSRFRSGQEVEIAFFFKDAPINFREVKLDQLEAVKNFERKIQGNGAFSKSFKDEDGLKFEVNIFLDKLARKFSSGSSRDISSYTTRYINFEKSDSSINNVSSEILDEFEELGLLDITENLQNNAQMATVSLSGMTDKLNFLSDIISNISDEMASKSINGPLQPVDAKPFIAEISSAMDEFSSYIEIELPVFSEKALLLAGDIRALIGVSYDFVRNDENSLDELEPFRLMVEQMAKGMDLSIAGFLTMQNTITSLQRMTVGFNKSRRRLVGNITNIINAITNSKSLIIQALREIDDLIRFVKLDGDLTS